MLDDMARTRPTLERLPNLHTLEWLCQDINSMERATLFMHKHLRHLIRSASGACHTSGSLHLRVPYTARFIEADVLEVFPS